MAAASVAVTLWRQPHPVLAPSFYAEEGAIYYRTALLEPFFAALFASHQGYFALVSNAIPLLAERAVAVEHAPWVTSLFALVICQLPVVHVLTSRARLFDPPVARFGTSAAACLLAGFFLSTLFSYVFLTLLAFLVLVEEAEPQSASLGRRVLNRGLLLLAGLGGPMTAFLLPAVLLVGWRRRELRVAAAILLGCAAVQAVALLHADSDQSYRTVAEVGLLPVVVLTNFVDALVPFDGGQPLNFFCLEIRDAGGAGVRILSAAATLLLAVGCWLLWRRLPRPEATVCVGSLLGLSVLATALGASPLDHDLLYKTSPRYTYAANVVLLVALLRGACGSGAGRFACAGLAVLGLVAGVERLWSRAIEPTTIVWRDEVRKWRDDPRYMPRVPPAGWLLSMQREVPRVTVRAEPMPDTVDPRPGGVRLEVSQYVQDGLAVLVSRVQGRPFASGFGIIGYMREPGGIELPDETGRLRVDLNRDALFRVPVRLDANGYFYTETSMWLFAPFANDVLAGQVLIQQPEPRLSNAVRIEVN